MKKKYLCTGNEACAEGAVRAGCDFYAGYPITPQNEITAYMSRRMEEVGKVFIQAESEIAAINMVFGASAAGARALTSSSSPGISLKQEGISYLAGAQLPAVIVNVMRGGPGLGNISASQADYFQATKGGGHGDYRLIVLAPETVQEMFDLTYKAFGLADKYRMQVMILADGILGQMMEPLVIDEEKGPVKKVEKRWALTGAKGRNPQKICSLFLGDGVLENLNLELQKKYREIEKSEVMAEIYKPENNDVLFVAYGTMSRIAKTCIDKLKEKGINASLVRPITLWPFPYKEVKESASKTKTVFVLEMSAGQMIEDVRLAIFDDDKINFIGRMGGEIPSEKEILEQVIKTLALRHREGTK